jgi:hypothetical protein
MSAPRPPAFKTGQGEGFGSSASRKNINNSSSKRDLSDLPIFKLLKAFNLN